MNTTIQARQPVIVKVKSSYKEKNNTHKYWIYENVRSAGLFKCKEVIIKKGKPGIWPLPELTGQPQTGQPFNSDQERPTSSFSWQYCI